MKNVLESFNIDYAAAPHDGGSVVLLIFPYQPFESYPAGHLLVDNYYLTAHKGYHRINEVIATLRAEGFDAARYKNEPLKELAVRLGAGRQCRNSLVYTQKYGSYVYFDAIHVFNFELENVSPQEAFCEAFTQNYEDCNLCFLACPNGALSEQGFNRGRCLRQFMDKRHSPSEEEKSLIGERLMGCMECRTACPKNAHIKPVPIPADLLAATKKESINMDKIKEYIGGNLFKKS